MFDLWKFSRANLFRFVPIVQKPENHSRQGVYLQYARVCNRIVNVLLAHKSCMLTNSREEQANFTCSGLIRSTVCQQNMCSVSNFPWKLTSCQNISVASFIVYNIMLKCSIAINCEAFNTNYI